MCVLCEFEMTHGRAGPSFMGPEALTVFGARFNKMNTKIRYEYEYIFKMRKEITTNDISKKADKYHITSQNLEK